MGRDYGARDVGVLTQRFMRIEKFIPLWAEDLTSMTTPLEVGSSARVRMDVSTRNSYGVLFLLYKDPV